MGKVTDMFFLSMLWLLFSLPIVTLGASTSALYYVSLKLAKDSEGYIWQSFWLAFRQDFKQSTIIWIIMFIVGIFISLDLFFYYNVQFEYAVALFWAFVVLGILYLFVITMLFPLIARLDTGIREMFTMGFMVSIKNFSWTMLMVITTLCFLALGIFVFWPVLIITPGAVAYIHSKILVHIIFPKYDWNET